MKNLCMIMVALIAMTSYEKVLLKKDPVNDPETNFEYLWEQVNNKYSYFEEKDIDWN